MVDINICSTCPKSKDIYDYLKHACDSAVDASFHYEAFLDNCSKSCQIQGKNNFKEKFETISNINQTVTLDIPIHEYDNYSKIKATAFIENNEIKLNIEME